jgi:hypothetical protein
VSNLPVPSPRDWAVGDLADATMLNTELRDVVNFLIAPPIFVAKQTVAQAMPTSAYAAITFTAEEIDSYGGHDNVTNNSRYTAQVAGWYHVLGIVQWAVNATGRRACGLFVNGTRMRQTEGCTVTTASGTTTSIAETELYLNVNDYVEIQGWQSTGANLNTQVAFPNSASMLCVLWLHA